MPGTFTFRPIEANLTHDTDWIKNMDPYCAYMVNHKRIKGQVCKAGGQHPVWNDAITVETNQEACVVELMDKDFLIDDSIGTFVIDLNEVQNMGKVSKWYPVFHKNKPAGQILFESIYQPPQPVIQQSQPVLITEAPKTIIKETIIEQEIIPEERIVQQGLTTTPIIGGQNLDEPLYGRVVDSKALRNLPDHPIGGGEFVSGSQNLYSGNLGGPLAGSLGGGILGTTELKGEQILVKEKRIEQTQFTQISGSQLGNQWQGNQPLGGQWQSNQPLGGQWQSNQPLTHAEMSNAQLGGGLNRGLYDDKKLSRLDEENPIGMQEAMKPNLRGEAQRLRNVNDLVPGDVIGGYTETNQGGNQGLGGQNLGNQGLGGQNLGNQGLLGQNLGNQNLGTGNFSTLPRPQ